MAVEAQQKGVYAGVHRGAGLLLEKCRDRSVRSLGAKLGCLGSRRIHLRMHGSHISLPGQKNRNKEKAGVDESLPNSFALRALSVVLYY